MAGDRLYRAAGFEVDPAELFSELNSMGILSWDGPPKPAWFAAMGLIF